MALIFKQQIGTYTLDIKRTNLDIYSADSTIYKELRITFNADSTFQMNTQVPFMYDSCGSWITGDNSPYSSSNELYYKTFKYPIYRGKLLGEQFVCHWTQTDTSFLINSGTPKKGEKNIPKIYFVKCK